MATGVLGSRRRRLQAQRKGRMTMSTQTRSRAQHLLDLEKHQFAPVLGRSTGVVIDHAKGSYMWSVDGRRYLDFAMGIAVVNTGHGHPKVLEAAKAQMEKVVHPAATVAHYEANILLTEKLAAITPGDLDVTFLTNTGAKNTDEMVGMLPGQRSMMGIGEFVCNPSPAGHGYRPEFYWNMSFILPRSDCTRGWLSTLERASSSWSSSFCRLLSFEGTWTRTST